MSEAQPDLPCPFEKRFPSQLVRDDTFFMALAYNQAIDAWRRDEVPIGAVIEVGGEVVASAHNTVEGVRDPTAHAEMLALTQAASKLGDWRLEGATVYVIKEPCPMCSGAMLMSRVRRVCYAVPDPKMGCLGGATNLNDLPRVNHHLELTAGGVLAAGALFTALGGDYPRVGTICAMIYALGIFAIWLVREPVMES